jgi:hypothetical protein
LGSSPPPPAAWRPPYRSVELATLVLEGKTAEEATQEAEAAWSGSLEEDHRRALELMQAHRDALQDAMTELMGPEQFSKGLEISQKQFLELVKARCHNPPKSPKGRATKSIYPWRAIPMQVARRSVYTKRGNLSSLSC